MNSSSVLTITAIALLLIPSQGQQVDSAKTPSLPGTYYSAQSIDSPKRPVMPPMPVNPFPELPVYSIGDGLFVYDDREVDYAAMRKEAAEKAATQGVAGGEAFAAEAGGGGGPPMATLKIGNLGNGTLAFGITMAPAGSIWDLYFVSIMVVENDIVGQRWQWRRVYSGVQCDANGEATFSMQQPDPSQGFFVILDAADADGDGLGNGYEDWFKYGDNGVTTVTNRFDSDFDTMRDGWEVEYGLNPTSSVGNDGGAANPDGDFQGLLALTNLREFNGYNSPSAPFGSFDPLKFLQVFPFPLNRPVVWITAETTNPVCGQASFTIHRPEGSAADDTVPLLVYYSVGGELRYGTDYTNNPAPVTEPGDQDHPDGYPRIFLAKIPEHSQSVTVVASLIGQPLASGSKTLQVALTPYSVSRKTQEPSAPAWGYVVDLLNKRDRTTITFDIVNLTPSALSQSVQVCRDTARLITLRGLGNCSLSFMIVDPPTNGSLSGLNPMNGTVTYTPNTGYCGPDNFTFKVTNGGVDSQPATVTIQVCASGRALITGNVASLAINGGDIITVDFSDGSTVNSFNPAATFNGRGLAIHNNEIFYSGVRNDDKDIHVCPYGTEGSGSVTDTRILTNTWRPFVGIQDLAFHENVLYALTGYEVDPLKVFALDPATGAVIGNPMGVSILQTNQGILPKSDADGFTVLPNGNFLINDKDGAGCACPYREYSATTGQLIPPPQGLEINLGTFGFTMATGVALAPDGQSLYFICDFQTIVQTDLAGNLMCSQGIQPPGQVFIEDIDVLEFPFPQP